MNNRAGLRIAVVGVSSLIGEAVIDELRVRKVAFAELHALDDERNVGRPVTDEGAESATALAVGDVAGFDFRAWIWPSFAGVRQYPSAMPRRQPRMRGS